MLMDKLLRLTASEDPKRPLVCLVDGAEELGGQWWFNLQFLFAKEIREEYPLVLVLAVDADSASADELIEGEPTPCAVGRSLVGKGLAQWLSLPALTRSEAGAWLGPAQDALVGAAVEMSGGLGGDLALLWTEWRERGLIRRSERDRWVPVDSLEAFDGYGTRALGRRLFERLPEPPSELSEKAIRALSCAALQGRTFTADGVADALGWEREGTIDLFDLLVDDDSSQLGILEELEAIEVRNMELSDPRSLCRYRFLRGTDWRAALSRMSEAERGQEAQRLVGALSSLHAPELHAIAHILAGICRVAGDSRGAAYYEARAFGPSRAVHRAFARALLEADIADWSIWDFRDAARRLLAASVVLTVSDLPADVLTYAEKAEVFARRANPIGRGLEADALCKQAHVLTIVSDYDEARQRLRKAMKLVEHGYPHVLAVALKGLASVEVDSDGDFAEATLMAERAAGLFRRERDFTQLGSSTLILSRIAIQEGDLERSRSLGESALSQAEKGREEGFVGTMLYHLAVIERNAKRLEPSYDYVRAALAIKRRLGETRDMATCLTMVAEAENDRGNPQVAWQEAEAALKLQIEHENVRGVVGALEVIARAAERMGQRDKALAFFDEAERRFAEAGLKIEIKYPDRRGGSQT
jgi:tetratricopeptide (TPR) repeat protein